MTDNQERAYAELTKFQSLQSEIRILELKYESALDEAWNRRVNNEIK